MLKKTKLRYNEYYNMQGVFDELYQQSLNGNNFYKLIEIIGSETERCISLRAYASLLFSYLGGKRQKFSCAPCHDAPQMVH